MAPGKNTGWSVLTAADAKARLAARKLAPPCSRVVAYVLQDDETVLWCDGAWARPKKPPVADLAKVALVVVDGPVVTDAGLSLRYDDVVGGGFVARNATAFLFLGEVRAQDVFAVPEVFALFPAGLAVERIASLESPDGEIHIAGHFHAPVVVSGIGDSGAEIAKGTDVRIGAYARYLKGVPKRGVASFDELGELLPFLADRVDETDAWELLEELKDEELPDSFELPGLPGSGAGARKRAKPAAAKKKTATKVTAKKARGRPAPAKKALAKRRRAH